MAKWLFSSIVAMLCGIVFAEDVPPPQPPVPVVLPLPENIAPLAMPATMAVCSPTSPSASSIPHAEQSFDKVEHLLKAAAHLEAAGLGRDADKYWHRAEREWQALKNEMGSFHNKVGQLPKADGNTGHIVMVRLKMIELSRSKLIQLGLMDSVIEGAKRLGINLDANTTSCAFSETNAIHQFLQSVIAGPGVRVLADPKLVTMSNQPAFFRSGGEVFMPAKLRGKLKSETIPYGTEINLTPTVLPNRSIRMQIHYAVSEVAEPSHKFQVHGVAVPAIRKMELNTTAVLEPGKSLFLRGPLRKQQESSGKKEVLNPARADENEPKDRADSEEDTDLWILISPEIMEAIDGPHQIRQR